MVRQYVASRFAIVALICVAATFLFPAVQGPYSAVHGPVTALMSARAKLKLWLGMALAGLLLLNWRLPANCLFSFRNGRAPELCFLLPRGEGILVLRC